MKEKLRKLVGYGFILTVLFGAMLEAKASANSITIAAANTTMNVVSIDRGRWRSRQYNRRYNRYRAFRNNYYYWLARFYRNYYYARARAYRNNYYRRNRAYRRSNPYYRNNGGYRGWHRHNRYRYYSRY